MNLATLFMHMRECIILRRRRVASTDEVIADFYTYLEQLGQKNAELEVKIRKCSQRALLHKQKASQEPTKLSRERELNRAKMFLKDKHRLLDDQDRTMRFMHLIRHQIDSISTSQMDNIMVDAMRQYNMTAKRMGFPDKSKDIDNLSKELQDRFQEVSELQSLLSEATDPSSLGVFKEQDDEEELLLELEGLLSSSDEPPHQEHMQETGLRQRPPSQTEPSSLVTLHNNNNNNVEVELEDKKECLLAVQLE